MLRGAEEQLITNTELVVVSAEGQARAHAGEVAIVQLISISKGVLFSISPYVASSQYRARLSCAGRCAGAGYWR